MPRKRRSRVYWRERGGVSRAYVDLRDLGGGREALIPPGETTATSDPDIAAKLAGDRVKKLEEQKRRGVIIGTEKKAELASYAAAHLRKKARTGKVTEGWLEQSERALREAIGFFGKDRDLISIGVEDVQLYLEHLQARSNGRGGTLSETSQRHYLNGLSNLYRRAASEAYVPPGFNPVAALLDKPSNQPQAEAEWLDVAEAALFLEAARRYKPEGGASPIYELMATYLLTGGRKSEVTGLEVDDISLRKGIITFRPNEWRRLKTRTSHRTVPLWPQLEEILRPYLMKRERAGGIGRLLFPSTKGDEEIMITDFRKVLDAVAESAGWKSGEIRSKRFRHTYCAARLQTMDRGEPVSVFTVARELGHSSTAMVERVYSHLGDVRHRSDVVEYRVDQHRKALGERLEKLEAGAAR